MLRVKVIQIGNSLGIVLPKEALRQMNVEKGDTVCLGQHAGGLLLTVEDTEFGKTLMVAEEGMKRYKNALRELAK